MSEEMKAVYEALLPPGAIWRPKPGGDFDKLLGGIGDNAQVLYEFIEALAWIRDPRRTTILKDLEKEYGLLTNTALTEQERRDQLAGIKYAIPDTASWEHVQDKLRAAGFANIYVTPNDPAVDPAPYLGELLVNGPIYVEQNPLYLAQANGSNMFAGNALAVAGYYLNIGRVAHQYSVPSLWRYWRFFFFVGGQATGFPPSIPAYNVDYKKEQLIKRLILKYKPLHSWAILVFNYIMIWTHRTPDASFSSWFNASYYGAGQYVIAGASAEIQTSPDGIDWTHQTKAGIYVGTFQAGAYGAGLYLLVGDNGEIETSPDGVTWTKRTPDGAYAGQFLGACYANNQFVIVGTGGEIQTSPDGINWTAQTAGGGFSGTFYSVHWGGGQYVAVGAPGTIQTSPDGITWTPQTAAGGYIGNFYSGSYGPEVYRHVICGTSGEIQTSQDGINWTKRTPDGGYVGAFRGAAFGNSRFVLVGNSGEIQSSLDGITWRHETQDAAYVGVFQEIGYGAGYFVAVGQIGEIQTS